MHDWNWWGWIPGNLSLCCSSLGWGSQGRCSSLLLPFTHVCYRMFYRFYRCLQMFTDVFTDVLQMFLQMFYTCLLSFVFTEVDCCLRPSFCTLLADLGSLEKFCTGSSVGFQDHSFLGVFWYNWAILTFSNISKLCIFSSNIWVKYFVQGKSRTNHHSGGSSIARV